MSSAGAMRSRGANGGTIRPPGRSHLYRLNSALLNAIADGKINVAKGLIAQGANVNFQNREGETTLSYATAWNQLEALKLLLAHGADPNVADRTGGTALMLAAQHGTAQMVRALIRRKADPLMKDGAGHTALDHVDWRGRADEEGEEIRRIMEKTKSTVRLTS